MKSNVWVRCAVYKTSLPCRYELVVDKSQRIETLTGKKVEQIQTSEKKFYFGGSPISPQYANFTGCISNAYFTRYTNF